VCVAGITEMIFRMYPPFPIPGFAPNFTGFGFGHTNISWYQFQKSVGQQIEDAVGMVCNSKYTRCTCENNSAVMFAQNIVERVIC